MSLENTVEEARHIFHECEMSGTAKSQRQEVSGSVLRGLGEGVGSGGASVRDDENAVNWVQLMAVQFSDETETTGIYT